MRQGRTALAERLSLLLSGKVLSAEADLRPYLRDQSIYQIEPQLVALPADVADMQQLVAFSAAEGLPLTARGGGSGTAGSALGEGIVMALPETPCWRRVDRFDIAAGGSARVRAGAGVPHNQLQNYLGQRGYFLPADVSSAEVSRIGGNIATKASGPHALRYGSIDRFIESLEFVTARGELVNTAIDATIPRRFKEQLVELEGQLRADQGAWDFLQQRKGLKTASGYNLFVFLDDQPFGRRLARLLAGSVGTLGLVVSATLRGEPKQEGRAAVLLYFDDLAEAARAVNLLRELAVSAIEVISRETAAILRQLTELPAGLAIDAHLLLVELSGPVAAEEAQRVVARLQAERLRLLRPPKLEGEEGIDRLWALRKQILWLIRQPRPGYRALAVVNDVGVPPEHLARFVAEAEQIFASHQLTALIYGHAGSGNLHLRPLFDITLPGLGERMRSLADDIYQLVLRHGGTITAEHGMGRLRAPYLEREWGPALYGYMRRLKEIFDPEGLLNPQVMFSDRPITDHLRPDLVLE